MRSRTTVGAPGTRRGVGPPRVAISPPVLVVPVTTRERDAGDHATAAARAVDQTHRHGRRLGRARPGGARHDARPAPPHPRFRGGGAEPGRAEAGQRSGALQHRPGGRRRRLRTGARRQGPGQRQPPRAPPVPRQGHRLRRARRGRPARAALGRDPRRAAPRDVRDRRAEGRLLPRPRRVDAPAVDGRRRDGHQRHRRRRRAVRGRVRLRRQTRRHRQRLGHLLRRRRGQHRVGPGDDEPGCRLEAPGLLLHREQPVRRVDHRAGGHRRRPPVGSRGVGFGIPSWQVDGQDTVAVYLAMQQACEHMRSGGGPTVVEVETYRYFHQNGPFPGSAFGYRSKDEETSWRERDPIAKVEHHLQRRGLYTAEDLAGVRKSIKAALSRDRCGPGRAGPERQAGPAAHPPRAVAGPGVPRRGHPGRPVRPGGRHGPRGGGLRPGRAGAAPHWSTSSPTPWPGGWSSTRRSSSWARTSTGSTVAPAAPPRASRRSSTTGCWAPRSPSAPSPGSAAAWPRTAGSTPSSS